MGDAPAAAVRPSRVRPIGVVMGVGARLHAVAAEPVVWSGASS